jgi:hypothetical protein
MWIAPPQVENLMEKAEPTSVQSELRRGLASVVASARPPLATRCRSAPSCGEEGQDQRPPQQSSPPARRPPPNVLSNAGPTWPRYPYSDHINLGPSRASTTVPDGAHNVAAIYWAPRRGQWAPTTHTIGSRISEEAHFISSTEMKRSSSLYLLLLLALCSLVQAQVLFQVHALPRNIVFVINGVLFQMLTALTRAMICLCRGLTGSRGRRREAGTIASMPASMTSPTPASRTSGCRHHRTPSPLKAC